MSLSAAANLAIDTLIPDPEPERLIFRKFDGVALSRAAERGDFNIKSADVETVALKVNPQELRQQEVKIINKVPTNASNHFVVFDWGNDLTMLSITGQTGNLMPSAVTSGSNPASPITNDLAARLDPLGETGLGAKSFEKVTATIDAYTQKILQGSLSYYEIIDLSPKYRTFKRLQQIFKDFDADMDVLTLEMGPFVYRGYFTEFSFTMSAENPWNWQYSLGYVILTDLSSLTRKEDEKTPEYDNIEKS